MASRVVQLNDATFDAWTANEIELTVVCVGAKWCDSTKALAPVLENLSTEHARAVRFTMVDFDESPEFVKAHNVTAVPTVLLFKLGQPCDSVDSICAIEARGDTAEQLAEARRSAIEEAIRRVV